MEPRSTFLQLNVLSALGLLVVVVAEGDEVVMVGEGDDPLAVLFRDGEEVLEDAHAALAEAGLEVVEDEVGEGLADLADVRDVVAHDDVGHGEVGGGAVGQVTDYQTVWHAPGQSSVFCR